MVRSILSRYEDRYSDVYSKTGDNNAVSDGDKVLFDVYQVLNSAVWLSLTKDESEDDQSYHSNLLRSTIFLKDSRPCLFLNSSLAIPYKLVSLTFFDTPTLILTLKTLSPCHFGRKFARWEKIRSLGMT